jgi:hypothetical protein
MHPKQDFLNNWSQSGAIDSSYADGTIVCLRKRTHMNVKAELIKLVTILWKGLHNLLHVSCWQLLSLSVQTRNFIQALCEGQMPNSWSDTHVFKGEKLFLSPLYPLDKDNMNLKARGVYLVPSLIWAALFLDAKVCILSVKRTLACSRVVQESVLTEEHSIMH